MNANEACSECCFVKKCKPSIERFRAIFERFYNFGSLLALLRHCRRLLRHFPSQSLGARNQELFIGGGNSWKDAGAICGGASF
jgi:hypothetical protein